MHPQAIEVAVVLAVLGCTTEAEPGLWPGIVAGARTLPCASCRHRALVWAFREIAEWELDSPEANWAAIRKAGGFAVSVGHWKWVAGRARIATSSIEPDAFGRRTLD